MKKLRLISAVAAALSLTFACFITVGASTVDEGLAMFVHEDLTISDGQVVVYGDAVAVGAVTGLGWDERVIDGKLFADVPESQMNSTVEKYLSATPYNKAQPEINITLKDFPNLTKKDSLTTANNVNITESGWYGEINVRNNGQPGLTITANEGEVVEIRADSFTLDSQVSISGSGTVLFYISKLYVSGSNNPSINKNGTAQVGLYLADDSNIVLQNLTGNFSIYTRQSNIAIKGDSQIVGNLYMNGLLIMEGSSIIKGYVGGNNLDAQFSGGYRQKINKSWRNVVIEGRLVANNVLMTGGSVVKLGSGITDINDGLAKSFKPSDPPEPPEPTDPPEPPVSDYEQGIKGEYFDAAEVTNQSALRKIQIDARPFFNWKYDSPDKSVIERETFAVRWSGFIKPEKSDYYTFKILSDDGIRLYVDENKLIDRWGYVNLEYTTAAPVYLEEGVYYPIMLEYQQLPYNSLVYLFWETEGEGISSVPASVLYITKQDKEEYQSAKYFNPVSGLGTGLENKFYAGEAAFDAGNESSTEVNMIDYQWNGGAPDGINTDSFYAVMEGFIEPKYTEQLTLTFEVDDAIRVWVDGVLIIDNWKASSRERVSGTFSAVVGKKARIKIEYADFYGGATCVMRWQSELQNCETVPAKYLYAN